MPTNKKDKIRKENREKRKDKTNARTYKKMNKIKERRITIQIKVISTMKRIVTNTINIRIGIIVINIKIKIKRTRVTNTKAVIGKMTEDRKNKADKMKRKNLFSRKNKFKRKKSWREFHSKLNNLKLLRKKKKKNS